MNEKRQKFFGRIMEVAIKARRLRSLLELPTVEDSRGFQRNQDNSQGRPGWRSPRPSQSLHPTLSFAVHPWHRP